MPNNKTISTGREDPKLDEIILENVPDGLRRNASDRVCSNGMPDTIRDIYEHAATLDPSGVRSLISSGAILKGLV